MYTPGDNFVVVVAVVVVVVVVVGRPFREDRTIS